MSLTIVQRAPFAAASGASVTATFTSATTPGNWIVARVGLTPVGSTVRSESLTDAGSNLYTLQAGESLGAHLRGEIWSAPIVTGGTGFTVEYQPAANGELGLDVIEVSGSGFAVDAFSVSNGGSGTALNSGSMTTTGASDLVVGLGVTATGGQSWTVGSGFTLGSSQAGSSGVSIAFFSEDQSGVGPGSIAATITSSVSSQWVCLGAALGAPSTTLNSGTGTFVETGEPASLLHTHILTASAGAFVETGESAGLTYNIATVFATAGSFSETGKSATLLHARDLLAAEGSFSLVGENALLTQNIATLIASAGSFTESGIAATLLVSHKLPSLAGAFVLTGEPASLFPGPAPLIAAAGSFSLTGESATLEHGRMLAASSGTFVVTGEPAVLGPSDLLMASSGTFLVGRISATLTHQYQLNTSPGTFVVVGENALLEQPFTLTAEPASFLVTGESAILTAEHVLTASHGTFVVNGIAAELTFFGLAGDVNYHVYSNTGIGDPINYSTPIDTTATLTFTTAPLSFPGTWSFGVRAFYTGNGLEEMNTDAAVTIVLDARGRDITNTPPSPLGLRAFAIAGGMIRVEFTEPPTSAAKQPVGFHVYWGSPTVNYGTIGATVLFNTGLAGSFVANIGPLTNGTTYQIGVRAYNSVSEETNTNTVSVAADNVGPSAVVDLVAIAVI